MGTLRLFSAPASRALGLLITAATIGATGCVAADRTAWLRHIKAPEVERASTQKQRLVAELRELYLVPDRYTPAEQIAAYAGQELENGNEWDAALLLSIASYRYHQQAVLASSIGHVQSMTINPVVRDQFYEWVGHEVRMFNEQHFDSELELLRQHLFGVAVASQHRDAYLRAVAGGGKEDDHFARRLNDIQTEMSNRTERLAHPELAEAFLARLQRDHAADQQNSYAFYYLAATPLDSFRMAALDETRTSFDGTLARNIVPRMQTLREQVRARLDHPQPTTRANAAALLGLAPEPGDVALLEARLGRESNGMVIDSIRFALLRNGNADQLAQLLDRARKISISEERDHALILLQWLPPELRTTFPEPLFVALATASSGVSTFGRSMALTILRDLAHQRTLSQKSVTALLELTADRDEQVAATAMNAVSALEQLSVAECKTLYEKYPTARDALVSRLGENASLADLAFLSQAYETSKDVEIQVAAAVAVAAIPGAASLQLLERWLAGAAKHEDGRPYMMLVALLASRTDVGQAELDALGLSRAKRVMVEMALDSRDLARAAAALDDVGMQDAMQIAILSGLLQRRALVPTLWKLARYRNDQFYPGDAMVRRHALGALVRMALQRRTEQSARMVAGR
jgi:hypothetical protein